MENHSDTLQPGTVIRGPERAYTVIKVLGQGGFGITYLVTGKVKVGNITLEGRFALKEHFISSLCSRDKATHAIQFSTPVADEVDRSMRAFIKEAQRLQSLGIDHPNIVKINEVFEANNTAYYVMEYLGGTTLLDYVEANGAMSPAAAKALLRPVVEAVAMLHRNNIAHYDIKPGNIMLHEEESGNVRPVLIDFGLAKHYNDRGHATSTLAAAGYTPGYAPVEQYAGIKEFTPQCDVYSLAATLYFCLTGHAPKPALELSATEVERELSAILPPEEIAPILRALSTMPATRTHDASALLNEVFDSAPIPVPKPPRKEEIPETKRIVGEPQDDDKPAFSMKTVFIAAAVVIIGVILWVVLKPGSSDDSTDTIAVDTVIGASDTELLTQVPGNVETPAEVVDSKEKVEDKTTDPVFRTVSGKVIDEKGETIMGASVVAGSYGTTTGFDGNFKLKLPEDVKTIRVSYVGYESQDVAVKENMTIRIQPETENTKFTPRTKCKNLDLYATRDGKNYFFSQSEWKSLPSDEKSKYDRKGVVVIGNGQHFAIALHDNGKALTWNKAMSLYGYSLPSKDQMEAFVKQYVAINKAIVNFGGDVNYKLWYWTRDEDKKDSSCAWAVTMPYGYVDSGHKNEPSRVRSIIPISSSDLYR